MSGARGGAVPASAAACREYVAAVLDQDTAYDGEPDGDPPLLAADYRRALYVLLALDPDELPPAADARPGGGRVRDELRALAPTGKLGKAGTSL